MFLLLLLLIQDAGRLSDVVPLSQGILIVDQDLQAEAGTGVQRQAAIPTYMGRGVGGLGNCFPPLLCLDSVGR